MKALMLLVMLLAPYAIHAGEEPASPTFEEILRRVVYRDSETGAILEVRAREDAPQPRIGLQMTIEETQDGIVVILSRNMKAGDGIYERYQLRKTDSILKEMENQNRFRLLQKDRDRRAREEQEKRVFELSGGKLRYGMTLRDVEAITGKPVEIESPAAEAGTETWIIPGFKLSFKAGVLVGVESVPKK